MGRHGICGEGREGKSQEGSYEICHKFCCQERASQPLCLNEWFLKSSPQFTWELVKKVNSQGSSQTYWIKISGIGGPAIHILWSPLSVSEATQEWEPLTQCVLILSSLSEHNCFPKFCNRHQTWIFILYWVLFLFWKQSIFCVDILENIEKDKWKRKKSSTIPQSRKRIVANLYLLIIFILYKYIYMYIWIMW